MPKGMEETAGRRPGAVIEGIQGIYLVQLSRNSAEAMSE